MNKPTKEQFKDYLIVQKSGITNMWYVDVICENSEHGLTRENCLYIMDHYKELVEEYQISMDDISYIDIFGAGILCNM